MTQKTGLEKFWQELKRRKVFKVITMYAGTAFIILQLFDIIANPLQLPAWTITLVIVLLCIGFIITILIAWIYDITPEGIKKTESIESVKKRKYQPPPVKRRLKTSDIIIAAMAIIIIILLYPKIFNRDTLEKLRASGERISVAIMPFQNMTNDTVWNVWQSGIQDILITSLSNSEELIVRQREAVDGIVQGRNLNNYASLTPSVASNISRKLDANVFVYGNIKKAGPAIRVYAQLIDSKTDQIFQSFQIEGPSAEEKIFGITDSLSTEIEEFLLISILKKGVPIPSESAKSAEAYRYLIYGLRSFVKIDYTSARNYFKQALAIDSNLNTAIVYTAHSYGNQGLYEQAKEWCLKAYGKREKMTEIQRLFTDWQYSYFFETPYEEIRHLKDILRIDDQDITAYYLLGLAYEELNQYGNAIPEFEKSLEIFRNRGIKPVWAYCYTGLGEAYHKTGELRKEKKLYKNAEKDFPDDQGLVYGQAILALSRGRIKDADEYIEKYRSVRINDSASEAALASGVGDIYWDAGIINKAEEYFRQALSLEPESPLRLNNLALLLIDDDKNIDEGMVLIEKALESAPEDYLYLYTKGWGLYKQGKYKEALVMLQKSWDLKPTYDHDIFLHLEAVKKAIANQKSN